MFSLLGEVPLAAAQTPKSITCPDGTVRIVIELKADRDPVRGRVVRGDPRQPDRPGARLTVEPKTLQQAAAATQQWNEFLKGLVAGYNSCVISKQSYEEGVKRIYPRLKNDAADIHASLARRSSCNTRLTSSHATRTSITCRRSRVSDTLEDR